MSKVRQIETTDGRMVQLRPVAPVTLARIQIAVEEELKASGVLVAKPTYQVTTITGDTETHEHDAESVQTPEEKAAWEKYEAGQAELQRLAAERTMKYALLRGLVCEDPPESWVEEMRYYGLAMPDDPRECKLRYIETEVLQTKADLQNATLAIMRLSTEGVDPALLKAAEASFRSDMEGSAAEPPPVPTGDVAVQPEPPTGGDGAVLGQDAERIPAPKPDGQGGDDRIAAYKAAHGGVGGAGDAARERQA